MTLCDLVKRLAAPILGIGTLAAVNNAYAGTALLLDDYDVQMYQNQTHQIQIGLFDISNGNMTPLVGGLLNITFSFYDPNPVNYDWTDPGVIFNPANFSISPSSQLTRVDGYASFTVQTYEDTLPGMYGYRVTGLDNRLVEVGEIDVSVIPEPSTLGLLGLGALALLAVRERYKV